jgi:ABC-type transport system involved in Fe-S cluster assembly fused permease/ATPase subunit
MTKVVMTQWLSAVRGADVIHVLEEGRLVESGGWDTQLGKEERFEPAKGAGID